ncbi:hypothetical protein [Streptomyces chartreusis]|uniref:hypothetical protein n=1 Tax=Streptomyces chartreusis TaxID=1969 RepID=UPI0034007185
MKSATPRTEITSRQEPGTALVPSIDLTPSGRLPFAVQAAPAVTRGPRTYQAVTNQLVDAGIDLARLMGDDPKLKAAYTALQYAAEAIEEYATNEPAADPAIGAHLSEVIDDFTTQAAEERAGARTPRQHLEADLTALVAATIPVAARLAHLLLEERPDVDLGVALEAETGWNGQLRDIIESAIAAVTRAHRAGKLVNPQ